MNTTVENAAQAVAVEEDVFGVVADVVIVMPIMSGIHIYIHSSILNNNPYYMFFFSVFLQLITIVGLVLLTKLCVNSFVSV